ncbi:CRE-BYN-1 protein [Caenorhabditis remanei]|uniref:CRE-BYN-1 protein n=1 Tax=Caenorhabditis remanei TaxID=31234 RepID=E3MCJ0_CAERE|nr:CRE-BYN-1 protein [Caenorhabditis remanei]
MVKKNLKGRGDKLSANAPLDNQLEAGNVAKQREELREKQKRKREESETDEFVPNSLSSKILNDARKQLLEEAIEENGDADSSTARVPKRQRGSWLGGDEQSEGDEEDNEDEQEEDNGFEDQIIELDPQDEADLARFLKKDAAQMSTLYDIIQAKIESKQNDAELALSQIDPNEFNMRDMDSEVVEMYEQIGQYMSKYRSGKVPKAFKIIPKMINWEQILFLTKPETWTAAAMYQATRLFASNMNPKMCQRFYTLVLLPRLRDDIDEFKKLNYHLYQALCKAIYKPSAFFKGLILPLLESGTCTLREAVIFSSVLTKVPIPIFHSAAAMLKIAEMEYTGANSVFLRALIDKKYALPYQAVDGVVNHFIRLKTDERDMPVLWHQCLLALCQRYKNDLSAEQKAAIHELIRVSWC